MLRVLGRNNSINVRKVLWLCDEIGQDYEREDWGQGYRSTDDPAFLALNPNGRIPVIIDDDLVLWESNVILRYLATKGARDDLLPAAPADRAGVELWMDWEVSDLAAAWRYAFQALVRRNPAYGNPKQVEASCLAWTAKIAVLEAQLESTGAYVAGAAFTLADIPIGLAVNRWFMTPIERPSYPAVAAYYDRLNQQLAFRRHGRNGVP